MKPRLLVAALCSTALGVGCGTSAADEGDLRIERVGAHSPAALELSHAIPNDGRAAQDPRAFRVVAPGASQVTIVRERPGEPEVARTFALDASHRTPWLRLVADRLDAEAPGAAGRLIEAALGDALVVRAGDEERRLPVGHQVLEGVVHVHVVQLNGVPAVGGDEPGALALARRQVRAANQRLAVCNVRLRAGTLRVVDVPPVSLLAIGDVRGFRAGGGRLRFRVQDGRRERAIEVAIPAGATPAETADAVAAELARLRVAARVLRHPRVARGALPSADVQVEGTLSLDGDAPLTTDVRQSAALAEVVLEDGLDTFGDHDAMRGTREERALLHGVVDRDPASIDVVVVPWLRNPRRRGESFIRADGSTLAGTVVLARRAVAETERAWTVAHEVGHVLLDQPFHPDVAGEDAPWRLMHAGSEDPTVRGPRRLTPAECARIRHRSGPDAALPLLSLPVDQAL